MISLEDSMSKINHDNVSDAVVQNLKNYILDNDMTTGDKLPTETELAQVLGISRASIREAMKTLEGTGVIHTIHGKGRFIRDFNFEQMVDNLSYNLKVHFKDFQDVVQVRMALEAYFLPSAALSFTSQDIEELECILDELERDIREGKPDRELVVTHTMFHRRLYQAFNNKLLDSLISMFSTFQRLLTTMDQCKTSNNEVFLTKHRELMDSLKSKDTEKVLECLKKHFTDFDQLGLK